MKKTNYITELVFLGVLLLIDIAFITQLLETQDNSLQIVDAIEYARVIIGLFTVALVGVIIQSLTKFGRYLKEHAGEDDRTSEEKANARLVWKLVGATGVLFFFYCFFIDRLGYYTTGLIVLELYQLVLYKAQEGALNKKAFVKITVISVAVVVILFLVFSVAFELYLPRGILR